MVLLSVPANDIDLSGLALDVALPIDWLTADLSDVDVAPSAPGHLKVRLSRSGPADIVVRGRVQATVAVPCARCLDPAQVPVDTELSLLLRPVKVGAPFPLPTSHSAHTANGSSSGRKKGDKDKEPEYEFTAEEADIDVYDGETVVLDPFVREAILLEMPNFPLCSEACPGIRPADSGGAAEQPAPPIDPRLAPLSALRDKLTQSARHASEQPRGDNGKPKKKKKKE